MQKGDAVRFVAIADWLSDLPDVYCLAIWKERATENGFAEHEDSPYRVTLVAGDRDEGQQRRYEGTHASSIYNALQGAVDSMLTDEAKAEIAALESGAVQAGRPRAPSEVPNLILEDARKVIRAAHYYLTHFAAPSGKFIGELPIEDFIAAARTLARARVAAFLGAPNEETP